MITRKGQRYRCQSLDCREQIEVMETSREHDSNALCRCGAKMKKVYSKPVFRELSSAEAIARFGDIAIPTATQMANLKENSDGKSAVD